MELAAAFRQSIKPTAWLLAFFVVLGIVLRFFGGTDIFWPGYISMLGFYMFIFFIASWAAQKKKKDHLLAQKSLPLWLAIFTMSATWVGGGFINGTAEYTFSSGLIWVQAPWGYALSLILGGLLFARPMRSRGYTTMLDPLEERFGKKLNILYYIPALTGDLFWTSAILVALGTTFGTIIGMDSQVAIIVSAFVVIFYTSLGGLWSVAVTDVIQLSILLFGLMLVLPFVYPEAGSVGRAWSIYSSQWGSAASLLPSKAALGTQYGLWWDSALLLILGGIPWQVYFQRVLAAKSARVAVRLSIFSGLVCLLAAIPAVLIGIGAYVTDWAGLGIPAPADAASVLPHTIRYLCSPVVATLGLGAVAAAVMSSADSSILAASSLTAWNIIPRFTRKKNRSLTQMIKRSIWVIGIAATLIALQVTSIYALWFLCSDLVYCLLFPALFTSLFDPKANGKGALAGFLVALILRSGGGEPVFHLPAWIPYPMDVDGIITIPFKTISMLAGLITIMTVSRLFPDKTM